METRHTHDIVIKKCKNMRYRKADKNGTGKSTWKH